MFGNQKFFKGFKIVVAVLVIIAMLGFLMIAGMFLDALGRRTRIPRVTLVMLFGLLVEHSLIFSALSAVLADSVRIPAHPPFVHENLYGMGLIF